MPLESKLKDTAIWLTDGTRLITGTMPLHEVLYRLRCRIGEIPVPDSKKEAVAKLKSLVDEAMQIIQDN